MDDKSRTKSPSNNSQDTVAKVHDVAEQARGVAIERADLVRDQAESAKAKAAERVRKLGHAVRKIGEHMRIEEQFYISERAQRASQQLESVASYIDDSELRTLIQDAESLTRRSPAWVIGGTFLVGLAAGRILKAPRDGNVLGDEQLTPQLTAAGERQAVREPAPRPARAAAVPTQRDEPPKQVEVRR